MPEAHDLPDDVDSGHGDLEDLEHSLDLRPITLDDIAANPDHKYEDESNIVDWKKRDHFKPSQAGKRKRVTRMRSGQELWGRAFTKIKSDKLKDCWSKFDIDGTKTERAKRYRYKALDQKWITDMVSVKMEAEAFNSGAMRRCFRTKKLSNFTHDESWSKRSNNFVAKSYINPVPRETYFDDVQLQMEAKLWSEEYNRHNPPKKVDIMQMYVVEMIDRPDSPLFHFEHYIEGNYVKYNSNSGFVRDENLRLTPQAFSHFTFERSGHELMVVDVQGVGDLYTDPQIHTAAGDSYGDGNLGTRGMALFFHTHVCNTICRSLNLTEFDLATSEDKELADQKKELSLSKTISRGMEEVCASPREHGFNLRAFMRRRNSSSGCWSDAGDSLSPELEPPSPISPLFNESSDSIQKPFGAKRTRFVSESSTGSIDATEAARFQELVSNNQRPSNIEAELTRMGNTTAAPSILGRIHFDLAKYHEVGRFLGAGREGEYDRAAALYHLERAVDCGIVEAIVTAADIYLRRPHDLLTDIEKEDNEENRKRGVALLEKAAEAGDRAAMVDAAQSYELGTYLPKAEADRDWNKAVKWYLKAVEIPEDESDQPAYQLLGRAAEMLKSGGPQLEPDYNRAAEYFNDAAEQASAAMKGRVANKYFMEAEECWSLCEPEEAEEATEG